MADEPREYDRDYRRPLPGPLQVRLGRDTKKQRVTRFFVQLEYHDGAEWREVVRYDHDACGAAEAVHDVTEEGLHMDIYRDGEKVATEFIAGPMSGAHAFDLAEEHLAQNLQRFVERFETWHGITTNDR